MNIFRNFCTFCKTYSSELSQISNKLDYMHINYSISYGIIEPVNDPAYHLYFLMKHV